MGSSRDKVKLVIDPVSNRGLLHAFNKMDKQANAQLRDDVSKISAWVARDLQQEAQLQATTSTRGATYRAHKIIQAQAFMPGQARVIGRSISVRRDRFPSIAIGGAKVKATTGASAGLLLFGNEFGSRRLFPNGGRRFPWPAPRLGNRSAGHWIFPFLRRAQPHITSEWKDAVERRVVKVWPDGRN